MQNWQYTLLVQFANSPSLKTILEGFNQAVDPSAVIDTFYNNVLNPQTATGWGLDVWGRIVGVNRIVQVASSEYLGFQEANDGSGTSQPFGQGIFYTGTNATSNYALTDEWYRKLIFAKAQANISSGSISSLNSILMSIFSGVGNIWVEETDENTMTVAYDWQITPVQASILNQSGILLRPSTISINYKFSGTLPIPTKTDFGGDIL